MVRGQPRIRAFAAPLPHTLAALRRVPASRLMTPPVRRALNSPSGLESTTSRRLNHACRQPQVQGIGLARMFLLPTLSRTFVATPSRTHRSVHGVLWTGGTALLGVSCIFFAFSHFYFASSPYGTCTPLYNFVFACIRMYRDVSVMYRSCIGHMYRSCIGHVSVMYWPY